MDLNELWKIVLGEIELSVSKPIFLTWFKNTSLCENKDGVILIQVPNAFTKEWLSSRYQKELLKIVRRYTPEVRALDFVIGKEPPAQAAVALPKISLQEKEAKVPLPLQEEVIDQETHLNPRYTFSSFIVGKFNELAYAAAQAIYREVGKLYNPLFVYGGVGLGKTHLLQAIGNEIKERYSGTKICYLSSERFTSELVSAIRNKNTENFKDRYRSTDVLLIDDIQFIAGKDTSQEELFHTFNALHERNRQIVFSSDRPPSAIPRLEERLKSRFEGGMIVDIGYPDFETRLAILKAKSQDRGLEISEKVLETVAMLIQRNIRELEGALNRLQIASRNTYINFPPEEVRRILAGAMLASKKPSWKQVAKIVAEFYGIEEKELLDKSRKRDVVRPRQVLMFILREELKSSFPFIGAKLGGRDHTTVIYACEKVEKEISSNGPVVEELNLIRERLRNCE